MIYCKKSDLNHYVGILPELDAAIERILGGKLSELHMGRNSWTENVFVNRFDYETQEEATMLYEDHEQYADIHLLLSGRELILVANADHLTWVEEKRDEDYTGYKGSEEACFVMTVDDVLIVFPGEAHKPKCIFSKAQKVEKAVVKVPVHPSSTTCK